jgi:hypothetical protein
MKTLVPVPRVLRALLGLGLLVAVAAPVVPAGADDALPGPITFGQNKIAYTTDYGEPGLDIAPDGTIYVTTPGSGGARWSRSDNLGVSWTTSKVVKPPGAPQTLTSGSDSDVAVAADGTVYMADLTIDGIEVSKSTDKGATFPQQTFIPFSADREWLATDGPHGETVYCAWHELATGTMLVEVSTDCGKTFGAPHPIYSQPATVAESAHNGTSIGGISTDGAGGVSILYGVTRPDTTDTTYGTPPISEIHMGMSRDSGATWSDVTVNPGAADANFGMFWMSSGVDTAGNLYAVYSGYAHKGEPDHVWLQESTDKGATWTAPYRVDDEGGNDLFGWVAGGGPGVAVVAWYHTDNVSKDANDSQWIVNVAQVRGLTTPAPHNETVAASNHIMHVGGICTLGIFCGVLPGSSSDRTLLDFFKVDVDPTGMVEVVWSENSSGKAVGGRTGVGFARQAGGESALDPTIYPPTP